MPNNLEILEKDSQSLITAGVRSTFILANRAVVAAGRGSGSVTRVPDPAPEPVVDPRCLWCDRTFTPRATGGSAQKFCCTGHRQQFWIAARRWTMRAIEVGLLPLGRLPKGVSHERARCLRGIPGPKEPPMPSTFGRAALKSEISADLDLPIGSRPSRVWLALYYSVKQSETKLCYRSRRDTGDRDLACRGADGQPLRRRGGGE
jgi:hypothetical protein